MTEVKSSEITTLECQFHEWQSKIYQRNILIKENLCQSKRNTSVSQVRWYDNLGLQVTLFCTDLIYVTRWTYVSQFLLSISNNGAILALVCCVRRNQYNPFPQSEWQTLKIKPPTFWMECQRCINWTMVPQWRCLRSHHWLYYSIQRILLCIKWQIQSKLTSCMIF